MSSQSFELTISFSFRALHVLAENFWLRPSCGQTWREERMCKWKLKGKPELVAVPIDLETYKEKLVEIAEILYQYLASSPNSCLRPKPIPVPVRGLTWEVRYE